MTVGSEHSNDGVNWATKVDTLINDPLSTSAVTVLYGSDTGTTVGGAFLRFKIELGGTTPSANLQIWVCGRSND